ncbi:YecA family protein [Mesobacillus maritimus]|uniref:SEC-C domain-containing protein n=1 Tax=Mesobacillus maritimus TaxID=1643336 RepID=A0ABS7KBC1_9BACI|nr:SEC-C metal-binding domain-containing protein [Mesobacillus maritimus]MBY0099582.1 SEC-C domain-containing protein [Mesobacillus maritimus]
MNFIERIKPHLISDDVLIQEVVLHAIHDFPYLSEENVNALVKEAFHNKEKQLSILVYIANHPLNEEAIQILIHSIPGMDKSKTHLAIDLLNQIEPKLALKYKPDLENYMNADKWALYELLANGTKEMVYAEYQKLVNTLDRAVEFQHDAFVKAKQVAAWMVTKGWVTEREIEAVIQAELKEPSFSFDGILNVYMIGRLKLEQFIPTLACLLDRDDDVLLDEVSVALIRFQSDEVVKEVKPYLLKDESIIFAASVVENIKSDLAVEALREAYHQVEEEDSQDLLIEALCHQFSEQALPEIREHMEKEYFSGLVDIEQAVYSYFAILGLEHPDLEEWRKVAMERELDFRSGSEQGKMLQSVPVHNETKVGRNDPCPCGSGKKYKKCCGK